MPARFFAMRDSFIREGMSREKAEGKAARIVNATLKSGEKAVGRHKSSHKHKR